MGHTFGAGYTFGTFRPYKVKIVTLKNKIFLEKFSLTPSEKGLVVLGMVALFQNKTPSLTVIRRRKNRWRKKTAAEKNNLL
jgi:hypothetical protein